MKAHHSIIFVLFIMGLASALAALAGCAAPGLRLAGRKEPLKPGLIIDLKTGRAVTAAELIERLARVRVVFLGELHQHPGQHHRQLEIIQGLFEKDPKLAVGLEVFARPDQDLLDGWVSGKIDENGFKEKAIGGILNLATFEVYFPLLDWARKNRIPLLALNAPRQTVGRVARRGLAGLDENQRRSIAREIEIGPSAYRDRVALAFDRHKNMGRLDNFFAAQIVWDETMAETLTDYLSSPAGRGRRAVVICGNEHVFMGYGLPARTARRLPASQAGVLMLVPDDDETLTSEAADFVWVFPPSPPRRRPRLGVALKNGPAGELLVSEVLPGSEAERIGLKTGDRLVMMDGRKLGSFMDLHRAAVEDGPDREHTLRVDRQGRSLDFRFRFREE